MTDATFRDDLTDPAAPTYDPEIVLDTMIGQGIYVPKTLKKILWNYFVPDIRQSFNAKALEVEKTYGDVYLPLPEKYDCP